MIAILFWMSLLPKATNFMMMNMPILDKTQREL
jgi:hypothetical protein